MDLGLKSKRVAVTGGSKGIGRAIAEGFAAEGANVSICARNAGEVTATVAALKAKGVKAFGQALDVADAPALAAWIAASAAELGGLDTLVCNVSALAVGDTKESWERSFAVDMMHTVNAVQAAVPHLEKSTGGSIVLISSVSGFEVDFAAGSYGAIKAALIHYAKGLSRQLVGKGIRVNCVSPGNTYFDGGIWQNIEKNMPDLFSSTLKVNPTGKFGTAEEVATRRRLPLEPDGQPDLRHQPGDRRRAHGSGVGEGSWHGRFARCPSEAGEAIRFALYKQMLADGFARAQLVAADLGDDGALVDHIAAFADRQDGVEILFHEQDRRAELVPDRLETSQIIWTIDGWMPSDGSSSSISCGLPTSARPIASCCCSPPLIVPADCRRRSLRIGKYR